MSITLKKNEKFLTFGFVTWNKVVPSTIKKNINIFWGISTAFVNFWRTAKINETKVFLFTLRMSSNGIVNLIQELH